MYKHDINTLPKYFDRYINLVPDLDLIDAMHKYGASYMDTEKPHFLTLGDKVYAEDKWTIKTILQHLIDAERIFTYRALRFARNDKTPLSGFDENEYAKANVSMRTIEDLLIEFAAVRQATLGLYLGFDDDIMQRQGTASGNEISVLALGFTIIGHVIHHTIVIRERYYPLISQ
ncbi:MAG: DinB family protein [Saprospiraceae bacterium]